VVSLTTSSLAQPFPATLATGLGSLLIARSISTGGGAARGAPAPTPAVPSSPAGSGAQAG
jgi:hypothetical protein